MEEQCPVCLHPLAIRTACPECDRDFDAPACNSCGFVSDTPYDNDEIKRICDAYAVISVSSYKLGNVEGVGFTMDVSPVDSEGKVDRGVAYDGLKSHLKWLGIDPDVVRERRKHFFRDDGTRGQSCDW